MQQSRMGFYINRGSQRGLLFWKNWLPALSAMHSFPPRDFGQPGELWYVRVLPPPFADGSEHIVFTTPYIVLTPESSEWLAYFGRALPSRAAIKDYERHMKFGPTRNAREGGALRA
jgi:hypothetical protein